MKRREEVLLALAGAVLRDPTVEGFKNDLRDLVARDPLDSVVMTILVGAHLFFEAEKEVNPKVKTFGDALVFVSTSISVGYSDIFAKSEKGKLIATALQAFGPALAAAALDKPASRAEEAASARAEALAQENVVTQRAIADKLDAILTELKAQRPPLTK